MEAKIGKRSTFDRIPQDSYPTPAAGTQFIEPCAGEGRLVEHLERAGHILVGQCRWIPDSPYDGKENAAWLLFGRPRPDRHAVTIFVGRQERSPMSDTLRLIDGYLEFEGRRVAKLESGLPPTLVHRLEEAFDALDEAEADIGEAEDRVAQLQARLAAPAPGAGS